MGKEPAARPGTVGRRTPMPDEPPATPASSLEARWRALSPRAQQRALRQYFDLPDAELADREALVGAEALAVLEQAIAAQPDNPQYRWAADRVRAGRLVILWRPPRWPSLYASIEDLLRELDTAAPTDAWADAPWPASGPPPGAPVDSRRPGDRRLPRFVGDDC